MHAQLVYVLHTTIVDEVLSHSGHYHIFVFGCLGWFAVDNVSNYHVFKAALTPKDNRLKHTDSVSP